MSTDLSSGAPWDVVVVGAGPAGAAAALAVLQASPRARVLMLDRADFPRDKPCGDGVAPHVLDVVSDLGVTGLLDDCVPVERLRITRGGRGVDRLTARPSYVVPRRVLDARLVDAALAAGAKLRRHRVRDVHQDASGVVIDGSIRAEVVVGSDGARSAVRGLAGRSHHRWALAVRGYAPVTPQRRGVQVIDFGSATGLTYAWSFDRGDGLANVGYGEVLRPGVPAPGRSRLVERLEEHLPGSTAGGTDWRGHHLPLSGARWRLPGGRVLLAGDAAGLVNPLTGEGLYYAVLTGAAAGRSAVAALRAGDAGSAGGRHARLTRRDLQPHLRHTAAASRLCAIGPVLDAGLAASAHDQRVFDDLVELGLGRGRLTPRIVCGLADSLLRRRGAEPEEHPIAATDSPSVTSPSPSPHRS